MSVTESCRITAQQEISPGIFSMELQTETIASSARPGQFVLVYSRDRSRMLPRPISLCEIDRARGTLRLVYRVTGPGTGTEEFSKYHPGVSLRITGPLGNGFPVGLAAGKRVMLMGGGIGIPPMLETARALPGSTAVLGYRSDCFLKDDFGSCCSVYIATEDGSRGVKGNVLDVVRQENLDADMIFACGPRPMLRAVKEYAAEHGIACYLSLEEKMACGVGACLGCVCTSVEKDEHSQVNNKRVCRDGPVFPAEEVEL